MSYVYCVSCGELIKIKEAKKILNGEYKCQPCFNDDEPDRQYNAKARDKRKDQEKRRRQRDDFEDYF